MAIVGIEGVLQQLQATAVSAANRSQNSEAPQGAFAAELKAAVNRISET
ncbi:MAG: flagellar hook-basal body complex protein FliE, partial [Hafnia sp.]